jgi:hypothetical protein
MTASPTSPQTTSLPPLGPLETAGAGVAGTSPCFGAGGGGSGPVGSVAGGGVVGSATGKGQALGQPMTGVGGHEEAGPSHHAGCLLGKDSGGQATSFDHHGGAGGGHGTLSGQQVGLAGHAASTGHPDGTGGAGGGGGSSGGPRMPPGSWSPGGGTTGNGQSEGGGGHGRPVVLHPIGAVPVEETGGNSIPAGQSGGTHPIGIGQGQPAGHPGGAWIWPS